MSLPVLYIVVPCYNEQEVLPITSKLFLEELERLTQDGRISGKSRVLFVNDGSSDRTWPIIRDLSQQDERFRGICLSRNRGHQNALLAGLMTAKDLCDITISIDADGQDDIRAMEAMVGEYEKGCEVVYGVRSRRTTDTFFKRSTAEGYYRLMNRMGANIVFNHADYRLMSSRVLREFANYREVNLFLRGMVPLVGFKSGTVSYERASRLAGESHYPLKKMLGLAFDGITSLTVEPIRLITGFGGCVTAASLAALIVFLVRCALGRAPGGWAWVLLAVCFFGGLILLGLGVIGEYVGKIYLETKARPRYIISETTWDSGDRQDRGQQQTAR